MKLSNAKNELPLERRAVDEACELFETLWGTHRRVSIEQILRGYTGISWPQRERLLSELIAVEVELRRSDGETPELREYAVRFPNHYRRIGRLLPASDAKPVKATDLSDEVGLVFPGFSGIEEIGRGGSGIVYRAWDNERSLPVALKVMKDPSFLTNFDSSGLLHEAMMIAGLDHPGIIKIHRIEQHKGRLILVLELVEGPNLDDHVDRLHNQGLETDIHWAAEFVSRLCEIVQFAHEQGVIHRDLKPSNVLLRKLSEPGRFSPVVTDFGLAKFELSGNTISRDGISFGTPGYMPPEQARGRSIEATPKSDVYSLGAILFFLVAGEKPFSSGSDLETIRSTCERDAPPLRQKRANTPEVIEAICSRCLQARPDDRFGSAAELAIALRKFHQSRFEGNRGELDAA